MNIAVVNGSPRKGNTYAALEAFAEGASDKHQIDWMWPDRLNISGCKGCGACQCYKGCVAQDDSNDAVNKLVDADMIVFATPVYWWGMTAQLKTLIDKCYCRGAQLKGKTVGVVVVGGAATDNEQYDIIKRQFDCMAKFLNWDLRFFESFSATKVGDLAGNASAMDKMRDLGKQI